MKSLAEADRGAFPHAARRKGFGADMDDPAQKSPGRQDERAASDRFAIGGLDPFDAAVFQENIGGLGVDHAEICDVPDCRLHRVPVELAVGLRPWAAHGGAFRAVKNAKLDSGFVRGASHKPVEGVDFAHEMALAEAADGGIAGHCANRGKGKGDESGACAHARRRRRRLAAGMAPAHHDHVKSAWNAVTPGLIV